MRCCQTLRQAFKCASNVVASSVFLYFALASWNEESICFQRISMSLFFVLLIGVDNCSAIIRTYLRKPSFEYETTTLLWIVFACNQVENDENCTNPGDNYFLTFCKFFFYLVLIGNTIIYGIFLLILVQQTITHGVYAQNENPLEYIDVQPDEPQNLTLQQIQKLEHLQYTVALQSYNPCSICQQDYEPMQELLRIPPCGHAYHQACIANWLLNNFTCPICRLDVG